MSLVTDDSLLAKLFCQKLKLTLTDQPKTQEEKETQLREIIQKEKEILEQEVGLGEPAEDKKGKKGGGGAKTAQDIENEIKDLLKPDISGWILIDFPRNISQAK